MQIIKDIMAAVTIPVMAKTRIGHFAESQILEGLGVDMIDESEGITFYVETLFLVSPVVYLQRLPNMLQCAPKHIQ